MTHLFDIKRFIGEFTINRQQKRAVEFLQPLLTYPPQKRMVRQAGFEPTTLWFVARYSIQLSYWRTNFAEGELYILESEKARVARKYSLIECRYTAANEAAAAEETKMPGQSELSGHFEGRFTFGRKRSQINPHGAESRLRTNDGRHHPLLPA